MLQVIWTKNSAIVCVTASDAEGVEETIGATLEHPFKVVGKGWVPAADLVPGDQVERLEGGAVC